MKTVLIIALLAVLVVAVLLIVRPSGPRVTVIKREEIDEDRDA
jgi:hypothetical protein